MFVFELVVASGRERLQEAWKWKLLSGDIVHEADDEDEERESRKAFSRLSQSFMLSVSALTSANVQVELPVRSNLFSRIVLPSKSN